MLFSSLTPFASPDGASLTHPTVSCERISRRRALPRGVTLIELMVALAITLIMMTAVITLFANISGAVTNSRALIEVSERLRTVRNRLQLDLAGHTVVQTWRRMGEALAWTCRSPADLARVRPMVENAMFEGFNP